MEEIKLSVCLLDVPKFIKLRDDNEYLENFIEERWRMISTRKRYTRDSKNSK